MSMLRNWKIALGLLVVFLAGMTIGSVGTLRWIQKRYEERANPDNWGPRTIAWLRTDLHLTPEQESQIRPRVDRAVGELVTLRDNADKDRKAIFHRMLGEVAQYLTPAQRDQLKTMLLDKKQPQDMRSP